MRHAGVQSQYKIQRWSTLFVVHALQSTHMRSLRASPAAPGRSRRQSHGALFFCKLALSPLQAEFGLWKQQFILLLHGLYAVD
jgi:hypothetical protein